MPEADEPRAPIAGFPRQLISIEVDEEGIVVPEVATPPDSSDSDEEDNEEEEATGVACGGCDDGNDIVVRVSKTTWRTIIYSPDMDGENVKLDDDGDVVVCDSDEIDDEITDEDITDTELYCRHCHQTVDFDGNIVVQ